MTTTTNHKRSIVDNDSMRVYVGFDKDRELKPYLFMFAGPYEDKIVKKTRRAYRDCTECHYHDTRVMLYESFINKMKKENVKVDFGNQLPILIEPDVEPQSFPLFDDNTPVEKKTARRTNKNKGLSIAVENDMIVEVSANAIF